MTAPTPPHSSHPVYPASCCSRFDFSITSVTGFPNTAPSPGRTSCRSRRCSGSAANPPRRHHRYSESAPFTKQVVRELWGSDATMRRVCGYRYFSVLAGDNILGYANAFRPAPDLEQALQDCLDDHLPDDLVEHRDARALRSLPQAIRSRAAADNKVGGNNSKWNGTRCANKVAINRPALESFAADAVDFERRSALQLLKLSRNTVCDGSIPVQYEQKSTGRLFMVGGSLQTVPREVRNAALAGYWDYDIENCHYAIVRQMAAAAGHDCPVITEYLQRKRQIRESLAAWTRAPGASIKSALISLLYGARLNPSEKTALGQELGPDAAVAFINAPFVKALAAEIAVVRRAILLRQERRRGRYTSLIGLEINPAKNNAAEVLCHLVQGIEAAALRAIVRRYGERIVLAMHDGWVSDMELDVAEMERLILDETGYELKVEASRLQVRPDRCRNANRRGGTRGESRCGSRT